MLKKNSRWVSILFFLEDNTPFTCLLSKSDSSNYFCIRQKSVHNISFTAKSNSSSEFFTNTDMKLFKLIWNISRRDTCVSCFIKNISPDVYFFDQYNLNSFVIPWKWSVQSTHEIRGFIRSTYSSDGDWLLKYTTYCDSGVYLRSSYLRFKNVLNLMFSKVLKCAGEKKRR